MTNIVQPYKAGLFLISIYYVVEDRFFNAQFFALLEYKDSKS